ncbi:MAG: DNA cytosine methyltransferase [Campylobacterota bacterium]
MSKIQRTMIDMLDHFDPEFGLIVDLFAGGGGASEGIRAAIGRDPDVAVNHDPDAVAMHQVNHPDTIHFTADVFEVDPKTIFPEYPVGLLWASPACTHFSKARGSKPVCKQLRSLAWVVVKWAKLRRPKMIFLENVEEFTDWGPVLDDGQPCPVRKGETFSRFVGELEKLGYQVEWRELRAHEYGAPTIRKRLFMVATCYGNAPVWPEATHGGSKGLKPYRTAADIIDWSVPSYSIFMTKEQVREQKLRINRPLKDASLRRIGKGLKKFVMQSKNPYIVDRPWIVKNYGGPKGAIGSSIDNPLGTVTTVDHNALATANMAPFVTTYFGERNGEADGRGTAMDKPLSTITSGGMRHGLVSAEVAPFIMMNNTGHPGGVMNDPLHTVTTGNHHAMISPVLIGIDNKSSKGSSWGPLDPLTTITTENRHALIENEMVQLLHVVRDFTSSVGSPVGDPIGTITTNGNGKAALCVSYAIKFRGTNYGYPVDEPAHTITAAGTHQGIVQTFLSTYYGQGQDIGQDVSDPLRTVVTKDRFAKVDVVFDPLTGASWDIETMDRIIQVREFIAHYCGPDLSDDERMGIVTIDGTKYQIIDIKLRMLKPRELYNAQGFRPDYIIDHTSDKKPIPGYAQVRMVGNSVCPPAAAALVRVNFEAWKRFANNPDSFAA